MKIQSYQTMVLISLFQLLSSCGINEVELYEGDYFPLQIGNKWYYSYDKNQTDINNTRKWEVISKKNIQGREYFLIESTYNASVTDTIYYRKEKNKIIELLIGKSKSEYYIENIFADFDIKENEFFQSYAMAFNGKDYYYNVTLKNKDEKRITLFYNILEARDEEHSITFEIGKGIIETTHYGWGPDNYLIHYELK